MTFIGTRGGNIVRRITASDVANAYYIFPDGNAFITLPSDQQWILRDLSLTAAGTDTTRALVYKNGGQTSMQVQNANNVASVNNRQFLVNPFRVEGGTTLKFEQLA